MNVYKNRNKWEARVNYRGVRHYVGSFKTKKLATAEAAKFERKLKELNSLTVDTYKVDYIRIRKNKNWLTHTLSWFEREAIRLKASWNK